MTELPLSKRQRTAETKNVHALETPRILQLVKQFQSFLDIARAKRVSRAFELKLPLLIGAQRRVRTERVRTFGCTFHVTRSRAAKCVFSVAFWKTSVGYLLNLSNSVLWWPRFLREHFPDWNIRYYVDPSVFRSVIASSFTADSDSDSESVAEPPYFDMTDWRELFASLAENNSNVEVWAYDGAWGHEFTGRRTVGTFGSIVRFHAATDPAVDVAVIRNLELLSSTADADNVKRWLGKNKRGFLMYAFTSHQGKRGSMGDYGIDIRAWDELEVYANAGVKAGLADGTRTIPAWTGFNRRAAYPVRFTERDIQSVLILSGLYKTFPYGSDEVTLAKLVAGQVDYKTTTICGYADLELKGEQDWPFMALIPQQYQPPAFITAALRKRWLEWPDRGLAKSLSDLLGPRDERESKMFSACVQHFRRLLVDAFRTPMKALRIDVTWIDWSLTAGLDDDQDKGILQLGALMAVFAPWTVFDGITVKHKLYLENFWPRSTLLAFRKKFQTAFL